MGRIFLAVYCLGILAVSSPANAQMTGKPRIIDGDTLEIAGQEIHLHGIDAPEGDQTCEISGKTWNCGLEATFALAFETAEHWVRCEESGRDEQGTVVAVCTIGPYDLGALMVRKGWALADRRVSADYVDEEAAARADGAGIWRGGFVSPREWRMHDPNTSRK